MPELVKIAFRTDEGVETAWAEPLGGDRYRLDNSPFYAYGVSWLDVVQALPAADTGGFPTFLRVLERSGHRTLRVVLDPPADRAPSSQAVLDHLVKLGCSHEGANPGYLAIDIPPGIDLNHVCRYLSSTGQQWEHVDPTYESLYPR